mgnify:CR=1 FL=1
MILHFISTADRFCYLHMIAVLSAIRCHKATQVWFWFMNEPTGIYWEKIKPLVQIKTFQEPNFPALKNKSDAFKATHLKDYTQWKILNTYGGLFLDLDTISVKDSTHWENHEFDLFVSLDVDDPDSIAFPYNNAVVLARSASPVAKMMAYYSDALMQQGDITWGTTGPILLSLMSNITHNGIKSVMSPAHQVFCPFGGNEISQIYEEKPELELPPKTEVIHLYAKASQMFEKVDTTFVRNSQSLLARTIRENLPESDWDISMWDEQKYLSSRGNHYVGLFEAIKCYQPRTILEIGTSAGDTAIGMIRTAGLKVPENEITYWGIDLFECGSDEVWDEEFTGGYRPPKLDMVYEKIKRETKAKINLLAVNSNNLTSKHLEEMGVPDLIYIDGGHSVITIQHDWLLAKEIAGPNTVIVFDDYFTEMPFVGCKVVVDAINKDEFDVKLRPELDTYTHPFGRLITGLAIVSRKTIDLTGNVEISYAPYHEWANAIMKEVRGND